MNILLRGAKQLNLDPEYIADRLEGTETYQPSEETLKIRQNLPKPPYQNLPKPPYQNLPMISVDELAEHTKDGDTWVSVLGYVIDVGTIPFWFKVHKGRDITTRALMGFHDIPMDINDDR